LSRRRISPRARTYVAATADAPLEDAIKYADIEQALDEALASRPDSWRVKKSVADLLGRLPELGYMQDGKFVYTREERDDLLSCRARQRVRRLQLYAEALPLVREELERLDDPDAIASNDAPELIQSQAGLFYYDFTRCFKIENLSDYCRQLTLTDFPSSQTTCPPPTTSKRISAKYRPTKRALPSSLPRPNPLKRPRPTENDARRS
jgi:hypothetical protein